MAPIAAGEPVLKFGQIIGFATAGHRAGRHIHEHNFAMGQDFDRDYAFARGRARSSRSCPSTEQATFQGFRRANGKVGTRNYLAILTTVNCSATVARFIAKEVEQSGILDDYPNIDGVVALVHGTGCGMADKGEGFEALKRTQWGYATNPNIAGVLLVGLGCEVFQIGRMKQRIRPRRGRPLPHHDDPGDRRHARRPIEAGVGAPQAHAAASPTQARRETVPASELMLALQCGGSDGYSGITANPALGAAADCWSTTAAPRSCRRRPRSMAPSIC